MWVFGGFIGNGMFGVFLPVGLLVAVALAVTLSIIK
jgi:hypothetical protein